MTVVQELGPPLAGTLRHEDARPVGEDRGLGNHFDDGARSKRQDPVSFDSGPNHGSIAPKGTGMDLQLCHFCHRTTDNYVQRAIVQCNIPSRPWRVPKSFVMLRQMAETRRDKRVLGHR